MSALAATQDAMQDWLLLGDAGIAAFVDGDERMAHRLRIYADAYRLRLLDVLGHDFPTTKATLGDDAFDALAANYLRAHPSTQPSVRHFGHAFAGWLATRREAPRFLHQLARFEWMQGECFDAVDAPALGIHHVAALPAEDWPALRLRLHPCVRLLALDCNAPQLAEAHARGTALPALRRRATSRWLLWRRAGDTHWRKLDADEAHALRAVEAGETFARICDRLHQPQADGAPRAASLLKRWLADGLLAAPSPH